jgi:tRNA(His) 5'-end guanylyltransferase
MASTTVTVTFYDVDVDVDVEFEPGWFKKGSRSGHIDDWTPDEGECAQIEKVTITLESGRVVDLTNRLTDRQRKKIQDACDRESEPEPHYDDEPCYDD